ncbi:MAG: hypothetical protein ACXQTX_03810 [Candidatus Syntropharchaeia archaeon]
MTLARLREILDYYAKVLDPDTTEVYIYRTYPFEGYKLLRAIILRTETGNDQKEEVKLVLASE